MLHVLSCANTETRGTQFAWTVNHHRAVNGHTVVLDISGSNLTTQDIIRDKVNESLMEAYASLTAVVLQIITTTIS